MPFDSHRAQIMHALDKTGPIPFLVWYTLLHVEAFLNVTLVMEMQIFVGNSCAVHRANGISDLLTGSEYFVSHTMNAHYAK